MELFNPQVELYAQQFTSPQNELLKEIEHYTLTHHAHPQMLSGHVQGRLLEMISRMIQPMRILEIGTFTGFSAICLAGGLVPGGVLHTIDISQEDAMIAKAYFDRSSVKEKIKLHVGNALQLIPTLNEVWDLVFIDADKTGYIDYYELTLPKIRQGGFIVADNVLFHGEVLNPEPAGKNAIAIQAFNEHVRKDNRTCQVLTTVRDGLLIIQKQGE